MKRREDDKASGVNNAAREVDRVFGIAVLASVFSSVGSYFPPKLFVDGTRAALWIAAGAVVLAGLSALVIPAQKNAWPKSPHPRDQSLCPKKSGHASSLRVSLSHPACKPGILRFLSSGLTFLISAPILGQETDEGGLHGSME
ncbi:MAG: hypothetical protein JXA87_02435 [Thermoleophilia bacterium]|nr:hypothetical protein [Thermoleophilia bacterium]